MNARDRHHVFLAVCRVMAEVEPAEFSGDRHSRSSIDGLRHVNNHLDALIEVVRNTTADSLEPYVAEIRQDVCSHCRFQYPTGYCPLRGMGSCLINRHADRILPAIARALVELGDEQYLRSHGDRPFGGSPGWGKLNATSTCK